MRPDSRTTSGSTSPKEDIWTGSCEVVGPRLVLRPHEDLIVHEVRPRDLPTSLDHSPFSLLGIQCDFVWTKEQTKEVN